MTISVSTHFCSSLDARFRQAHAALTHVPFRNGRLGDQADSQDALVAGGLGDNGCCTGSGAAPMPAVTKHMGVAS